jgi:beta-lactamase class A
MFVRPNASAPRGFAPLAPKAALPSVRPAAVVVSAAPAAEPEDPFRGRWEAMVEQLGREAKAHKGRVGIYTKDLKRGWDWSYKADDLFPSASLIKLPVMIGVFEKINRGELSLSERLVLKRRLRAGGSGTLKWARDGSRLSVRDLLDHLIHESDNTAMRILIDEVGLGFLQHHFQDMGLVFTEIYPEGLSLSSGRVRYENYTTAREMSMLLEKIYRGEIVDPFSSALMLEILKHHASRSRLAKSLPVGWEIAHKTGLLRRACHDVSIILSPDGDYILTVLTGQNPDYAYAKDFIARVGRITYVQYKGSSLSYAPASRPGK